MPARGSGIGASFRAVKLPMREGAPSLNGQGLYAVGRTSGLPSEIMWLWGLVAVEVFGLGVLRHLFRRDHAG